MKNEQILTNILKEELENEKTFVNALFTNEQVNNKMPITLNEEKDLPVHYFDQFSNQILEKIKNNESVVNTSTNKIIRITRLGKYAVAAAVLLIIASTYYLVTPSTLLMPSQQETSTQNISLQEISTEEIESYVDNYEWLNEADIQLEMSKIGAPHEFNKISNDSSN